MSRIKPILFSTPMVKAIMEAKKTMTRRVIKPQPEHKQLHEYMGEPVYDGEHRMWCYKNLVLENIWDFPNNNDRQKLAALCPYGKPGDVLWVRETWLEDTTDEKEWFYVYKANNEQYPIGSSKWRPSIFMPKAACRIFLEVTDVRVERLQDISDDDAFAEGVICEDFPNDTYSSAFVELWYKINGAESWKANPFVWVVSFKKINKPENF